MTGSNIPNFHIVDYLLFSLMLVISTGIGVYYALTGGRQRTSGEYLMADRSLPMIPVGFSLMASFMSAITTLGVPADVYFTGTMWWWFAVAHVVACWVNANTFMPIFYNLRLTSVHEYLELRFNKVVRFCGTIIFYVQKMMYLGVVVYTPCLALATITGFDFVTSVFVVGIVCTFYTTIGGMKAVVWADTFQMLIAFAGFLAIIIKGAMDLGLRNIWKINQEGERIEFLNFDPDPRVRHTVWSVVIGGSFQWTYAYAINQWQVQRYLTCKSLREAKGAIALLASGLVVVTCLACTCGLVAYAYYHDCDPYTLGRFKKTDQLIPYLVIDIFQNVPGLPGIFMAAVFSAALSTMSSALNSLAAVTGEDILKKLWPDMSDRRYTIINKIVAMCFGLLVIGLAFMAAELGKVVQTVMTFAGALGGPLMGVFFLGAFFPRASTKETLVGFITGISLSLWICIGAFLHPPIYGKLPLSIAGCDDDYVSNSTMMFSTIDDYAPNSTMMFSTNDVTSVLVTVSATPPVPFEETDIVKRSGLMGLYSVSYSWFAVLSSFTTVIIGLLGSLITGGNPPGSVDPKLICPLSNIFCSCLPNKWRVKLGCPATVETDDKYMDIPLEETDAIHSNKPRDPEKSC